MVLVSTWLHGIGLSYAWPTFEAAGIVTPGALADLDVSMFPALGVSDPEDRRKLFYLVQRIKIAVDDKEGDTVASTVDQVLAGNNIRTNRQLQQQQSKAESTTSAVPDSTSTEEEEEEDDEEEDVNGYEEEEEVPVRETETRVQEARRMLSAKVGSPRTKPLSSPARQTAPAPRPRQSPSHSPPSETKSTSPTSRPPPSRGNSRLSQPTKGRTSLPQPSAPKSRLPAKNASRVSPMRKQHSDVSIEKDENEWNQNGADDDDDDENFEDSVPQPSGGRAEGIASRTRSRTRQPSQGKAQTTPRQTSGLTPGRSRSEPKTRLQKPATTTPASRAKPKSNRTGKPLSVIHSERILPMSPLMELQQGNTESPAKAAHGSPQEKRRGLERPRSSSNSRRSSSSGHRRPQKGTAPRADVEEMSDSELSQQSGRSERSQRSTSSRASVGNTARRRQTGGRPAKREDDRRKTVATTKHHHRDTSDPNSFKSQIEDLREDHAEEHQLFMSSSYEEEDMRIRVVVRKRPMSRAEVVAAGDVDVIHPLDYGAHGRILVYQPKTRVDLTKEIETVPFSFDNVFDEASTNSQIYERTVRTLIPPLFDGQWGCVFAYGQTGSGKTFTMMGADMTTTNSNAPKNPQNLGLYYMAALDVFQALGTEGFEHFSVGVSLFEIYGGKLFDLLNDRTQIKCLEDHNGKVRFPGLSEHPLCSADDLMAVIEEGACNRSTGSTSRNADSSRSHAVLQLHIYEPMRGRRATKRTTEFSRLTFIDLAGSERGADTSTSNKETRMEGAEINTSLLALKEVIRALATGDSMTHVPFRGSKLTQVLKESFVGDNCRSVMIACISPNIGNCEQTLNSLRYANRVKERDPETGQLSGLVESAPPSSAKKVSRQLTGRNGGSRKDENEDEDRRLSEDSLVENIAPSSPSADSVLSSSTNALNEILGESDPADTAAQQVILCHKETMTSLLEMVKDEMALVNHVETNGMEQYITNVSEIHAKQLHMYSLLRDRIQEYREIRDAGGDGSDAGSVEDLRD